METKQVSREIKINDFDLDYVLNTLRGTPGVGVITADVLDIDIRVEEVRSGIYRIMTRFGAIGFCVGRNIDSIWSIRAARDNSQSCESPVFDFTKHEIEKLLSHFWLNRFVEMAIMGNLHFNTATDFELFRVLNGIDDRAN